MSRPTRDGPPSNSARGALQRASDSPTGRELAELTEPEDVGHVVAILGGTARKGSWEPPARLRVLALMGGVELDFRDANLLEGETVVEVLAVMGGVTIVVPPEVDVQASGAGFLGGFSSVSNEADAPDAPLLLVKGLAVMGGVDVKVKKLPLTRRLIRE